MENKRAQTLEVLSKLIQNQRALLSRTQSDIERLRDLRHEALTQPTAFLSDLSSELNSSSVKLSHQMDCFSSPFLEEIDWTLYTSYDSSALKAIAISSRRAYADRNQPHTTQRSDLSELQKLVKDARRTIVDPVLTQLAQESALYPPSEEEDDDELDPEELKRERERAKIRELKKRKITCGLTIPSRSRGLDGVYIRRDLEDESGEVDISVDDGYQPGGLTVSCPESTPMDVDIADTPHSPSVRKTTLPKQSRIRRPSTKLRTVETDEPQATPASSNNSRHKSTLNTALQEPEPPTSEVTTEPTLKRPRGTAKPKPETYKQSWSVSEQHLLERLLEEIPDGEKNRWQKISRAMMGRRTPRQVSSRVQKYFEKLKRFGVGVTLEES